MRILLLVSETEYFKIMKCSEKAMNVFFKKKITR